MAMKDFDFKQFLIQKGERVGLIAAGAIAVLLLLLFTILPSNKGLRSPGPGTSADLIIKTAKDKDNQLSVNKPTEDQVKSIVEVDPRLMTQAANPTRDADDFRFPEVFTAPPQASTKVARS